MGLALCHPRPSLKQPQGQLERRTISVQDFTYSVSYCGKRTDVLEVRLDFKAEIPFISKFTRLKMLLLRLGFFTCDVAVSPKETFVRFPLFEHQSFETELVI